MQHEKLHHLHKAPYFTVAFVVLNIDKILNDQISMLQKNIVFLYETNTLYLKKTK